MCDMYTWQRRSIFIKDNPIFSSEITLHKDYDRNVPLQKKKKSVVVSLKGFGAKTKWLAVNGQL
jgi:hypothetical protein